MARISNIAIAYFLAVVSFPATVMSAPPGQSVSPLGQVQFKVFQSLEGHKQWYGADQPSESEVIEWESELCFIHRLPHRYDSWGIRDTWRPTVLVRASCAVPLPSGEMRWLIRSRGLARLFIDGTQVVATKPMSGATDGHQPVAPIPTPPADGLSTVGYGDQESIATFSIPKGKVCELVFEFLVGGDKFRANPGTTLVAYQLPSDSTYRLLGVDTASAPITEAYIEACKNKVEMQLTALDDINRRSAAATRDDYWKKRRMWNADWLERKQVQQSKVQEAVQNNSSLHPIDDFIQQKLDNSFSMTRPGRDGDEELARKAIELLQAKCLRCHGEKAKGGLKLDSFDSAILAADSGLHAIVPGNVSDSELVFRIGKDSADDPMPPSGPLDDADVKLLSDWIAAGASWPSIDRKNHRIELAAVVGDAAFLRRASFDTIGLPPTVDELRTFTADRSTDKRKKTIERLLKDDRWADHWVSYWQDVLAENPSPLKPSLNNTGPFRWYLYEALRDGRGWDRLAFELIMMRGSEREGGSAGFGFAAENDAPMAAKAHILAAAFLGVEMKCARCHDSPYSSPTQRDLFSLAAMLGRKPAIVPKSSTVSPGFFDSLKGRESLIHVTLKPKEPVQPEFPFTNLIQPLNNASLADLLEDPTDTRERLALDITGAHNIRFAKVIVNRVWQRLFGYGIVEPVNDWEGVQSSHPELLDWLAEDFIASGFDARHLMQQIMASDAYQRSVNEFPDATKQTATVLSSVSMSNRFFSSQTRRRLSAEQIVDSLFFVTGTTMRVEELTFDQESRRPANSMISLGHPNRAWMFATLANERDRPSLNLPRAQAIVDVLSAFGWTGSRQNPIHDRDAESNVLQPGVLAGGVVTTWVTRASVENQLGDVAVAADSAANLVEYLFLRILGRHPTEVELTTYSNLLDEGFEDRVIPSSQVVIPNSPKPLPEVSWANHLSQEANSIKLELERRARSGDAPDPRLRTQWRELYEDLVWSLINSPEFIWIQ